MLVVRRLGKRVIACVFEGLVSVAGHVDSSKVLSGGSFHLEEERICWGEYAALLRET